MTLGYIRYSENLCGGIPSNVSGSYEKRRPVMSLARVGMSVAGVVGVLAATLAAATIWLLLTDPVTVADAVSEQDVTPFVRQLVNVIFQVLRQLVRYL